MFLASLEGRIMRTKRFTKGTAQSTIISSTMIFCMGNTGGGDYRSYFRERLRCFPKVPDLRQGGLWSARKGNNRSFPWKKSSFLQWSYQNILRRRFIKTNGTAV